VIKFVVKPTDKGWAIFRDEILVSVHPTRRKILLALAFLRADLKAQGQRSIVEFEPRARGWELTARDPRRARRKFAPARKHR
jgi:hypothetical protein